MGFNEVCLFSIKSLGLINYKFGFNRLCMFLILILVICIFSNLSMTMLICVFFNLSRTYMFITFCASSWFCFWLYMCMSILGFQLNWDIVYDSRFFCYIFMKLFVLCLWSYSLCYVLEMFMSYVCLYMKLSCSGVSVN